MQSDEEHPLLKYAVLEPARCRQHAPHPLLSKGADAVVHLSRYLDLPDPTARLVQLEKYYGEILPPVGCEIQIPQSREEQKLVYGWKQALRWFGINSPRRLEYDRLIEAAMRPAVSFHTPVMTALLLLKLGLINRDREMALHISIEGRLGAQAKYIAFPMLFFGDSKVEIKSEEQRLRRATRVMSKGLIHPNRDAVTAQGSGIKPLFRTEIRTSRLYSDQTEGGLRLRSGFIQDIAASQLLAAAALSTDPELQGAWRRYQAALESYVASLPPAFGDFLAADWYQSTGDPRDHRLLALLPIMQQHLAIRRAALDKEMKASLRGNLQAIRGEAVQAVHQALRSVDPTRCPDWLAQCSSGRDEVMALLPPELAERLLD